jgi:CubicO group peptidase (beta-lactamase class C family)
MAADTICRIASMTKPIVAACAMTLVEDCTLRLDDPVDALLPELGGHDHARRSERATGRHRPGETPDNAAGSAHL